MVVSQSGESAEVVRLVDELGPSTGRPFVLSVTNGLGNRLARRADVALDTRAGREQGPSTMTFAAALVVLSAVGRVLGGDEPAAILDAVRDEAEATAAGAEVVLSDAPDRARSYRRWLGDRTTLATLGRGAARAAAEMGALGLKEAARFAAESLEAAQFRHGPLELAGPELAVAIVATEPVTRALDLGLAAELVSRAPRSWWPPPTARARTAP